MVLACHFWSCHEIHFVCKIHIEKTQTYRKGLGLKGVINDIRFHVLNPIQLTPHLHMQINKNGCCVSERRAKALKSLFA